ncbi:MAG: PspA/IM30 family protein [Sphaerochaetaceae bacterium]|nr:PspA/IM30 family protein [Sphaerochaetaceae bacterium]
MNAFKRMKNIINSNVNSTLDKMEDPQKMIRLMIAELEETLAKARTSLAARIADKTARAEEKKQLEASLRRWEDRAKLAVEKGRDDLAREALIEKKHVSERLQVLSDELAQYEGIIASQQDQIVKLQEKLQEIRDKERTLVARAYHAKEKKKVVETLRATDSSAMCQKFSDLESKIERMEADAEMAGFTGSKGTEAQFAEMEKNDEIEAELNKLKASMAAPAPKAEKPKAATKKDEEK